jgi:hypothetical protein
MTRRPLLAQSRHEPLHCTCPLLGVKQTSVTNHTLKASKFASEIARELMDLRRVANLSVRRARLLVALCALYCRNR